MFALEQKGSIAYSEGVLVVLVAQQAMPTYGVIVLYQ
jgi:hypothetical protein